MSIARLSLCCKFDILCHSVSDLLLQMQPRHHYLKLPLQANFYPMPSQAYIQDSHHRLTLHTAQSLGVSSLESGLCFIKSYLMPLFHYLNESHPCHCLQPFMD